MYFAWTINDLRDSIDDWPYNTVIFLDDDAAGNTDVDAIIVVDGVTDAVVSRGVPASFFCSHVLRVIWSSYASRSS